jgi:D-alanyl-D-alanine dipeptidase
MNCLRDCTPILNKLFISIFLSSALSAELVDLKKLIPSLVIDLRYATANNFTGKQLYPISARPIFLKKLPNH